MDPKSPGDWVCPSCGTCADAAGTCPKHPEEQLMNARDRNVLEFLMREDDKANNKASAIWVLVLGPAGLALGGLVAWGLNSAFYDLMPRKLMTWMVIGGGVLGGLGGKLVASRLHKDKFEHVTRRLLEPKGTT